ncbi:LysM peptidoglycan-binding domain-containing protein [Brevibacillus choshinensis]|uniref:LysM peptidoglycan-binding domain-containing protein n=1 Tax=Brevibacillus choshinensis TaxID=54911 RepID=UPI002E23CA71|nr:LysM peptidoglycan-binding domain-containing protein [Brevibacillus choshinensis]
MFRTTRWKRLAAQTSLIALMLPATSAFAQPISVAPGDTLGNLAYHYQVSVEQLKIANHLKTDMIQSGQSLYIPPRSEIYTVKSGDVLWKIAADHQTTIPTIMEINQRTSYDLFVGEKILVPTVSATTTDSTYTVKSGDFLWKIASRYNVSIQSILDANRLTSTDLLIGQKLLIPKTTGQASNQTGSQKDKDTATPANDATKPWVENTRYQVKQDDTPWTISIDHGIPMTELLQVNKLSENAELQIGQSLIIPVHHIPETSIKSSKYGEYLDWFEASQYLFPINTVATVTDFETGRSFQVKRTIGASHSDTEPLTAADTAKIKDIWGGDFSWSVRPVIVDVNGRRIAASMTSMPHSIEYITNNNFTGHFDIHFLNSLRHKDNAIDPDHQEAIKVAAGRK